MNTNVISAQLRQAKTLVMPGFRATRNIRQWWRTVRLQTAAPLTLQLLKRTDKAVWIERYLATAHCESLYCVSEALAFLNFVLAQNTDDARLSAVAAFERALARLHTPRERAIAPNVNALNQPNALLARHPLSTLVLFPVSPEPLLGSLLQNAPLAAADREKNECHPVLIAPGVTKRWRLASPSEAKLLVRFVKPLTASTVQCWPRATRELAITLYREQALRVKPMR